MPLQRCQRSHRRKVITMARGGKEPAARRLIACPQGKDVKGLRHEAHSLIKALGIQLVREYRVGSGMHPVEGQDRQPTRGDCPQSGEAGLGQYSG
jgi:hypothetical protein